MADTRVRRELWRLYLNGLLTQFFAAILYSVSMTGYLPSYHRFVTNPTKESLNDTDLSKIKPGLGESELFYSFTITCIHIGSIVGGILIATLLKCVPYWYLFVFSISCHVLGYILYGTATHGWVLVVAMPMIGFFLGAEVTLVFSYATDISVEYVELLKERGEKFECERSKAVKIRNYLYANHSIGYSIGFALGTGVATLFSNLPIDQYQSIAWFNLACGLALLISFVFFFRGEASWKSRISQCRQNRCCSMDKADLSLRPIQVFILISALALSFVEMQKWAYLEVLFSPVLSDSFGLSLRLSSYFYLGLTIPRIMGAILVVVLQKVKCSTQVIAFIGIVMAISSYLMMADWQAIPYDPCTEYSPFHHPNRFQNQTLLAERFNKTSVQTYPLPMAQATPSSLSLLSALDIYQDVEIDLDNDESFHVKLPIRSHYNCRLDSSCSCNDDVFKPCIFFTMDVNGHISPQRTRVKDIPQLFSCSLNSIAMFCVSIYHDRVPAGTVEDLLADVEIQRLMVLPDDVYAAASNVCMNASSQNCHWIPFSTLTGKKCNDCPPICRGKQQTLIFPLFLLGMAILVLSNPLIWVPTIAIANNNSPKSLQAIVIGAVNAVNALSQSVGPVLMDVLYERTQKRVFASSLLLASMHSPFLIEIIVLYKQLGPNLDRTEYQQLKEEEED